MSNISWGHLLFGFSGRINRAKWWLTVLVSIIISVVAAIVSAVLQSETLGAVVTLGAFIPQLWISLAAGVKRLHDLNRTGAWLVLFYLGPLFLLIVFFAYAGLSVGAELLTGGENLDPAALAGIGVFAIIIGLIAIALGIWAFVWFGCLRGTVGPNQYGPDPLEGRV